MKQLFVDRHHWQRIDRVERRFHGPVKEAGPILSPVKPWEGERLHLWNSPVWNPERGLWQLWYIGGEELLPLYAESEDGLHWQRPDLGRVEWNGSRANNIINLGFPARFKERRLVLLRDERDPDPRRRYKALTRVSGKLIGLVSADGLDWTRLPGPEIPSNDEYRLGYDGINHRYIATAKGSPVPAFDRAVTLSVSDDFVNWSRAELVFWGDEVDQDNGRRRIARAGQDPDRRHPLINDPDLYHTDVYNMPVFSYADLYLALPVMFNHSGLYWYPHPDDQPPKLRSNQDGILQPELAWSRDLREWHRPPDREPFIPLSPLSDPDNYDHGAIHALPPVINHDQLWFYYYGARFTHVKKSVLEEAGLRKSADEPLGAVFRAGMRLDGFVSLRAGDEPGVVLSRPVMVDGPGLYMNVDTLQGELRVELRDAETGRVIPGYGMGDRMGDPLIRSADGGSRRMRFGTGARFEDDNRDDHTVAIRENGTAVPVRWRDRQDVAELQGRMVRVCMYLRQADLYAFQFAR